MADKGINYDLKLAIEQFEKNIEQAKKLADSFGGEFKKSTKESSQAWNTFTGVLGAEVFIKISRAVYDMGASFVDSAKDIEDMTVQFEVLTGSVKTSKKLIADLQKFGAETPFEMKGISDASKNLLAYGFTASEVVPKLKQIGDVASATGTQLADVAQIYGQVAATGKITGERLNQFQEKGIPILQAIATQLGITSAKAREMISSTNGVPFATFEKAFAGLSAQGGIAFDGMIKQSKTLSGVISTAKDNVTIFAADMGAKLLPTIKQMVLFSGDLIVKLREMISWVSNNVSWLVPLAAGITTVSLATYLWGQRMVILESITKSVTIAQAAFNAVMSANPVGLIIIGIGALVSGLVYLYMNLDKTKAKFYEWSIAGLKAIEPLESGFRMVLGSILEMFAKTYGTIIQTSFQLANELTSMFGLDLPDAMTSFGDNLLKTAENFKNGGGTIKSQIDDLTASADALKKKMEGPMGPPKPDNLEPDAPAKKTKADLIREEQLAKEAEAYKLAQMMRKDHYAQLDLVDEEYKINHDALQAENMALTLEQRQAIQEEEIANKYLFEQQKADVELQGALAKASQEKDAQKKAEMIRDANYKNELDKAKAQGKYKVDIEKQVLKEKKELADVEKAQMAGILNAAAGFLQLGVELAKKGSRERKALAIAGALVNTYVAASGALAMMPWTPANYGMAALAVAQGLMNVSKITSTGNFANGGQAGSIAGIVPGTSVSGDKLNIGVNSGELIMKRAQQDSIAAQLTNQGGFSDSQIDRLINAIFGMKITMVADDNELARSVSRGVINGIVIGSSR